MEDLGEAGWSEKKLRGAGKKLRARLMANLPALRILIEKVQEKARSGFLRGLDGRTLPVRSPHSALNTLLQSAGALVCKKWLVVLHKRLAEAGLKWGMDYNQVAWVHDETQIECRLGLGEIIGRTSVEAIEAAGEHFNFRCALSGEYKVGKNWAMTH